MVVPDFELICEIMLVAEGFLDARLLARKFITLYTLCKELLSKQVITSSNMTKVIADLVVLTKKGPFLKLSHIKCVGVLLYETHKFH